MLSALIASLALTVAALACAVWTGLRRRRRAHYAFVGGHVALLAVAIAIAERYGRTLVFEGAALALHRLHFAGVALTFASLPLLVISGVRLARASPEAAPARRAAHRRAAVAFVALVVVTFVLGLAMTVLAGRVAS